VAKGNQHWVRNAKTSSRFGIATLEKASKFSKSAQTREWRQLNDGAAISERFAKEGIPTTAEHFELLEMLDEPMGQKYLGRYAIKNQTMDLLFCFLDMCEFRSVRTMSLRRLKALHIFDKYYNEDINMGGEAAKNHPNNQRAGECSLRLEDIPTHARVRLLRNIERLRGDLEAEADAIMYDDVRRHVFDLVYWRIYIPFSSSALAKKFARRKGLRYNYVTVADFDYLEKLGQGGYGRVVHVRKNSTGRHYAMKASLKKNLVASQKKKGTRIDTEKKVFEACVNPYIVGLDYALQTPFYCVLVLEYIPGGDLKKLLQSTPDGFLPRSLVILYSAEIILAMSHLHELGLLYRDLKPCNVMLRGNGHVAIGDMGCVGDVKGKVLGFKETDSKPNSDNLVRRRTVMGTRGYMAPEMLILLTRQKKNHPRMPGYLESVDYWALGVTIYELFCGFHPYVYQDYAALVKRLRQIRANDSSRTAFEGKELGMLVRFPAHVERTDRSLIRGLLEVDVRKRLGVSERENGFAALKNHAAFNGIDWEKLLLGHVEAFWKPQEQPYRAVSSFPTFDATMAWMDLQETQMGFTKHVANGEMIDARDQELFNTWDYISQRTLKIEMGVSGIMETLEKNYKVRQVMGPTEADLALTQRPRKNSLMSMFGSKASSSSALMSASATQGSSFVDTVKRRSSSVVKRLKSVAVADPASREQERERMQSIAKKSAKVAPAPGTPVLGAVESKGTQPSLPIPQTSVASTRKVDRAQSVDTGVANRKREYGSGAGAHLRARPASGSNNGTAEQDRREEPSEARPASGSNGTAEKDRRKESSARQESPVESAAGASAAAEARSSG